MALLKTTRSTKCCFSNSSGNERLCGLRKLRKPFCYLRTLSEPKCKCSLKEVSTGIILNSIKHSK